MKQIKLLTITFKEKIKASETPLLRGAVIHSMQEESTLFHNHLEGNKLRYSYPLIQYKALHGQAAIVCLGDGADAIGEFFSAEPKALRIGHRHISLEVESINAREHDIAATQEPRLYRLKRWMPLNQANYRTYHSLEGIGDKILFLQRMLTANILSFLKGMGIHLDERLEVTITRLTPLHGVSFKGVKVMAFDAAFKCNIALPHHIGLGKGVSLGYGTLCGDKAQYKDNA